MNQNSKESQQSNRPDRADLREAVRKATRQFGSMLPILCGVVLLIGLLRAALPSSALERVFTGNPLLDALTGAGIGSLLAGNPVNSYVISEQLLADGVSLFAIAAFIVSWVTVGIAQLPAEAMTLGNRFALIRNVLSFALAVIIGLVTAVLVSLTGGVA